VTGAVLVLLDCASGGGGGGGGGGVTLTPAAWTNIYNTGIGQNNAVTFSGFTGALSVTATNSGPGILGYAKNGAHFGTPYAGAFTMNASDTLAWVVNEPSGGSSYSGTVVVTDATHSVVLATFTYTIIGV
jgi:hypothetical protein